jgi:hypothetical protein
MHGVKWNSVEHGGGDELNELVRLGIGMDGREKRETTTCTSVNDFLARLCNIHPKKQSAKNKKEPEQGRKRRVLCHKSE